MSNVSTEKKRDPVIDLMRGIGLLLVMSAHVRSDSFYFNFRQFDVTLLMFVSGMSFVCSAKPVSYRSYVNKRVGRLLVPVFLFLVLYLPIHTFVFHFELSVPEIIKSFLLLAGGIEFVWIYRVMFTTALLNPFLKKAVDSLNLWICYGILAISLFMNDFLYRGIFGELHSPLDKIMIYLVTFTVGYACISAFGMLFVKLDNAKKMIFTAVSTLLFLGLACFFRFAELQPFKHPPMTYYIFYGIMWSGFLYIVCSRWKHEISSWKWIKWLSVNSMDIYLSHIFWFYLFQTLNLETHISSILLYLIIVLSSVGSTLLVQIVRKNVRGAA